MSCHRCHLDIELLPSLEEDNARFQQVISHIQQCPHCLARYHTARKLDKVLETELLNTPPLPPSFSARIMDNLQYSLMPRLRRAILEEIKSSPIHPTATWIHQQIKQGFPRITLRTVCRHLAVLRDDGDILELDFGEGQKHFDGNLTPHFHFICQQCKEIYDICQSPHKLIDLTEIQNICHKVLEHSLQLRGVCRKCRID